MPGKRLAGGRARQPRGSRAARPCERGVCAMRSLLPAPTPRAAPAGSPGGGRAAAPAPLPPAGTGRPRPRALPPRSGSLRAGEALGTAGCGAPFVERLNSLLFRPPRQPVTIPAPAPAPRSKEHMFPLGLPARLTTSHGQGKAAPGTKAESEIWNVKARGRSDGGCRKERSISPFSVLRRRFSVNCRYHNASLLPAQVSRGDSLHSPTCHS